MLRNSLAWMPHWELFLLPNILDKQVSTQVVAREDDPLLQWEDLTLFPLDFRDVRLAEDLELRLHWHGRADDADDGRALGSVDRRLSRATVLDGKMAVVKAASTPATRALAKMHRMCKAA